MMSCCFALLQSTDKQETHIGTSTERQFEEQFFDSLVIGRGSAGLMYALKVAEHGTVAVLTKRSKVESNTRWAQGGIAAVMGAHDSFESHIADTIKAGDVLNNPEVVRVCVEEGPERLAELLSLGVSFTYREQEGELDLTREGGHSERRIVHAARQAEHVPIHWTGVLRV